MVIAKAGKTLKQLKGQFEIKMTSRIHEVDRSKPVLQTIDNHYCQVVRERRPPMFAQM